MRSIDNFLRASCDRARNSFPLPNAIFSLDLSAGELAVYAYLMYCEDRKSHQCWPSYKTIGQAVGMSRNTVQKYVRELEYKVLIITEPTKYESESGQIRNGSVVQSEDLIVAYSKLCSQLEKIAGEVNS